MELNKTLADTLKKPAYSPCPAFASICSGMRWDPAHGHVPRGFLGAVGSTEEIELILVFAEPGDPHTGETHKSMQSAYQYAMHCFETGKDQFHRNVRHILDSCWPRLSFADQMRKVWMTESVLCSAKAEGAHVTAAVERECGSRYLKKQLESLPGALTVALGSKAKARLRRVGVQDFLPAFAVAPPGCNFPDARESWARIPEELIRRRGRH